MRYKILKHDGAEGFAETGHEFEGDATAVNLKLDVLARETGVPHAVKQIGNLEPDNASLDTPNPDAKTGTSKGMPPLEDPHSRGGVPARTSGVLPGTTNASGTAPPSVKGAGTPHLDKAHGHGPDRHRDDAKAKADADAKAKKAK